MSHSYDCPLCPSAVNSNGLEKFSKSCSLFFSHRQLVNEKKPPFLTVARCSKLRRSYHVSDALISLHSLRVPERIRSKVVVLVYKVLHSCAPSYLGLFTYVADLPSRRGLRSSCSDCLVQPPVHRSTVGNRAFSVAGPQVWNCLPPEDTSAPSLTTSALDAGRSCLRNHILTFG